MVSGAGKIRSVAKKFLGSGVPAPDAHVLNLPDEAGLNQRGGCFQWERLGASNVAMIRFESGAASPAILSGRGA